MAGTSPNKSIWSGPGLTAGARGDVALVPPVRRGATATRLQAFVPVVLLALLLGVLYALGTHRLRTGALWSVGHDVVLRCYGLLLGASVASALAPTRRREVLLASSVIAYPVALGMLSLAVWSYALVVCGLVRVGALARRRLVLVQITVALVLWAIVPVGRWYLLPRQLQVGTTLLAIVWTQFAYSSIFLIIEHARNPGRLSLRDDLFYLLAMPRLIEPFFQPISPTYLCSRERPADLGLALRGAALGILAISLSTFLRVTPDLNAFLSFAPALRWGVSFLHYYARVAAQIFMAVAIFRLMGFDLSSGHRTPWLSSSFAEFFRRFNHYVRDAVLSLFFLPALGWLRTRVSRRLAPMLAALFGVLVGSFLLNDLLVPLAISHDPVAALRGWYAPGRIAALILFWGAIILPTRTLASVSEADHATRWRRVARVLRFNAMWAGIFLLEAMSGWTGGHPLMKPDR